MGLLDDAIREHLELKRRHGGDAAEITQQEQEALGPVRRTARGTAEEEPPAPETEVPAETAAGVEDPEPPQGGEVPVVAEEADDEPEPDLPPPGAGGTGAPAGPGLADFGSDFDDAPAAEDRSRPIADIDQPTEEWGFDDDEAKEEEPEPEEDPLEDTPDFLQETPEHDRLWFEQKPPKDFDFDQ